jgi:mRNA interferase RelE/StbE
MSKNALREMSTLPRHLIEETLDTIEALLENPIPPGSIKLTGYANAYRVRFGNERYRILYTVNAHRRYIHVFRVRARPTAYQKLRRP